MTLPYCPDMKIYYLLKIPFKSFTILSDVQSNLTLRTVTIRTCLTLRLASVAGAVIQAIGRPEFEDGLRAGVLLEDC